MLNTKRKVFRTNLMLPVRVVRTFDEPIPARYDLAVFVAAGIGGAGV
jgi:hypothetical protein